MRPKIDIATEVNTDQGEPGGIQDEVTKVTVPDAVKRRNTRHFLWAVGHDRRISDSFRFEPWAK